MPIVVLVCHLLRICPFWGSFMRNLVHLGVCAGVGALLLEHRLLQPHR
jgi:hypothetical protein